MSKHSILVIKLVPVYIHSQFTCYLLICYFPDNTAVKNPPASAGDIRDPGSIPDLGRSSGEGNGNPLQYSCLENLMDRGVWWATVHGVAKSWAQLR